MSFSPSQIVLGATSQQLGVHLGVLDNQFAGIELVSSAENGGWIDFKRNTLNTDYHGRIRYASSGIFAGMGFYTGNGSSVGIERLRVLPNGNVGIGTTNPTEKLQVVGNLNLSSGSSFKINGADVLTGSGLGTGVTGSSLTSVGTLSSLLVSGNVGVGTATATQKLHVNGNLRVGTAVLTQPSGNAPLFAARAWVNFNGIPTTPTIRSHGNITSVTRNNVGDYTISFTTAMPNENYIFTGMSMRADTGSFPRTVTYTAGFTKTTSQIRLQTQATGTTTISNESNVYVAFFV